MTIKIKILGVTITNVQIKPESLHNQQTHRLLWQQTNMEISQHFQPPTTKSTTEELHQVHPNKKPKFALNTLPIGININVSIGKE